MKKYCKIIIANILAIAIYFPLNAQQYCIPNFVDPDCGDGFVIHSFILDGENGTGINELNTGCAPGAYHDGTNLPAPHLFTGTSYNINMSSIAYEELLGMPISGTGAVVWIDFNNNGIFEASERITMSPNVLHPNGSNVPLHIPNNANHGMHRMRIVAGMVNAIGGNTSMFLEQFEPCPNLLSQPMIGEVHDYNIYIMDSTSTVDCDDPIIDLGGIRELCEGASVTLDAGNPGLTYSWNTNETTQSISVNTPGTYFVTVYDGLCAGSDTVEVIVMDLPSIQTFDYLENPNGSITFTAVGANNVSNYTWDFGDGNTGTGASVTHSYSQESSYVVTLTASNDCGEDVVSKTIFASVSISELNALPIEIYPNPSKGLINIDSYNKYIDEIIIFDNLGREVDRFSGNNKTKYLLNISHFKPGMYYIRILLEDKSIIKNFILH